MILAEHGYSCKTTSIHSTLVYGPSTQGDYRNETVQSDDPDYYPANGQKGSYWYVKTSPQ